MNAKMRLKLNEAQGKIESAATIIEGVAEDENEHMENMPENLQESERYIKMEDAASELESIVEDLGEICSRLQEVM